jgi:hypothetical protein
MISILLGGITHHYIGSNFNYCNKINNYGTIANPYAVVLAGDENKKLGAILGKDSACGNIFGPMSSIRLSNNIDFIAGFYNTNKEKFEKIGLVSPSIYGVTPVVGANYKIPITKKVSLNNIISIGVITHAISFNF